MEAVAAGGEEVVGPGLGELEDVAAAASYVLYEALVVAFLVACLVHLQHVVVSLVKPEI